ncbi:SusD/RagB family nutrient-binding outer membrane lipoprotein [uncultured Bacteroides sp.]|uniref:SusD/RagB family nutrient-binding outer membrane lipoprotein n=1 Tax=uncultured Bacteroides sp. TaxID=162156 RepID=UPI002AABAD1F|nr:SusD/RagB family nutrient-binding outer membrane lipoprotein [uncultured Bacteroides sp.]
MKKYSLNISLSMVLLAFLFSGCTSSFDEVNSDPDNSTDAPAANILTYCLQYATTNLFGQWCDMNEPSTYGGQLTKIQYIDEAKYVYRPSVVENKWFYLYRTMNNLRTVEAKAAAQNSPGMYGIAKVFEMQMMQITTDTWRDVPYTDALKISNGVLLPKYDSQETIYPGMLAELKSAADSLAKAGSGSVSSLTSGDAIYNGKIAKWQKYCNSLRLRLAMRISGVDASLAKATVEEILANPSKYPVITSNDDNAFYMWPGSKPYLEPWYSDEHSDGRDDHGLSDVMVNTLKSLSDPRLPVYAFPATSDGQYRGFTIGAKSQPDLTIISRIGARFRENAAGFTPYFRACETYFDIAEASKLGWATGSTAKAAYEKAVTLSLQENGVADAAIATYLAGPALYDGTNNQLYLQEWISLFKQGMEAWSLYRRTGVPTTNYVAPASTYTGHNVSPLRYPYPATETSLNGANSAASVAKVVDDFWGQKMWWDTRSGVQ